MATASLAFPDTATPTLSVLDPRGLVIRNVAYCRQRPEQIAESRITRQTFDAAGRLVASWDPRLWGTAPKPNLATVYGLSGQPLLTESVDAGCQLNLPGEAGAPRSNWDSRGSQRHSEYDLLQRPVTVSEWMAGESPRVVERFTYGDASGGFAAHNQCGQPVRHDDPAGTRRLADYAVNGLPLAEKRQFLDSLDLPDWPLDIQSRDDLLEDGEGFVTAQVYTASGEMQSQTDAMGNLRMFAYTLAGELKATRLQLAGAGEQPRVLVSAIHYNAFGQVESESAGNGVNTTADYAADDGRLIRLQAQVPGGNVLQDLNYGYDPMRNILNIKDQSQLTRYFNNQRIDPINRYRYDSLYQLVEATGREVITPSYGPALPLLQPTPLDPNQLRNYTQAFAYDRAGNLLIRQHSGAPTFGMATSRTSNRSLAQHDDGTLPDEDQIANGFDACGNQLELQRGQTMSWDARNQLSRVTMVKRDDGPDDQEHYIYGRPGHRLRKVRLTQTGSRTLRAEVRYLPGLEIHRDAVTGEKRHVISVDAGRNSVRVLHWEKTPPAGLGNDQLRYSLSDHLGSCTLELDKNAGLLSQEGYYPFGGTAWWAASSVTVAGYKTIRYSGKERDATGLYYYGYRYYAPWLQRWVNPDPAGDVDGLGLYQMVGNRPITLRDERGLVGGRPNQVLPEQLGKWRLEGLQLSHSNLMSKDAVGHNIQVSFKLTYEGSRLDRWLGRMQEMPALTWDENIVLNDFVKKESWEFKANMYEHNPSSRTLEVWPKRYVEAYNSASGQPGLHRGSVTLLDLQERPVNINQLGNDISDSEGKARSVRSYLKNNGGKLAVVVHDVPSIVLRENTHKERLLEVSVGLRGSEAKVSASQYLYVDNTRAPAVVRSAFDMEYVSMRHEGFIKVNAPHSSQKRSYLRLPGEYL